MQHLPILPIVIPLLAGVLLLLPPLCHSLPRQRFIAVAVNLALIVTAVMLLQRTHLEGALTYALGDWPSPFGIVLVADRISALLTLLTSLLGLGALLYACAGDDKNGMYFHPLFMFQLMGVNGAFLTGDIFNLFVFFEVLLIASYALLIHGGGKQKTRAAVHYVIINLVGSCLFLFALGTLYGVLGTLNIADMAAKATLLGPDEQPLAKAGGLLLLAVFGLKAALLPFYFWLPRSYSSASAPVAALFAIMTKVGAYSILRIHTTIFGAGAGALAEIATPWLQPLALLTLIIGSIGALASPSLRTLTANLTLVSMGILLTAIALQRADATAAALYYTIHTTLVTGALFLLADMIGRQRGKAEDRFVASRRMQRPVALGVAFIIAAIAATGAPPLSGFVGKVLLLQATEGPVEAGLIWPIVLISGLAAIIALSRAGSSLFWRHSEDAPVAEPTPALRIIAVYLLLAASPLLVVFGGPITEFTDAAATQLHDSAALSGMMQQGGS
ncbi:monovalent cation/H+ antiporter subunit D [Hahella sp. CR1]|uniref:monovalent cation/H+ antiporter subunit D n=1 Tax=Hahella sp. CR1 TaxID=2992807 RepID=UPI0024431B8C|nr:monovalent cation/H+ antiporter subunit D [Hahella sp. CR1]MDG9668952.1 monovalent cation/H+ antiporter subunit D [Hahella sp. CR1]